MKPKIYASQEWVESKLEDFDVPDVDLNGYVKVPTAEVGQTIKVKSVDDNGVPTAWEAVDFPSVPTKVSQLANDSGFQTESEVTAIVEEAIADIEIPSGGGGSGGSNPFRLLRTVTIPTDASTDTSGVTWLERPQGGYWFGFDTDADGNPFEVTELIITHDVACVTGASTGEQFYRINSGAVPFYGGGKKFVAYQPKSAKSWQWVHFLGVFTQWFGCYNGGAGVNTVYAERFMNTDAKVEKCSSISIGINNGQDYGLTAGKISFYGR